MAVNVLYCINLYLFSRPSETSSSSHKINSLTNSYSSHLSGERHEWRSYWRVSHMYTSKLLILSNPGRSTIQKSGGYHAAEFFNAFMNFETSFLNQYNESVACSFTDKIYRSPVLSYRHFQHLNQFKSVIAKNWPTWFENAWQSRCHPEETSYLEGKMRRRHLWYVSIDVQLSYSEQ